MNRPACRASALLAALASAILGTVVVTSVAGAATASDVTVTGTASVDSAGDLLNYAFTVGNAAGPPLNGVTVDGTSFSGSGPQPVLACPQSSLPSGVTEKCTASYRLTATDMSAGSITYTAKLNGTDSAGTAIAGPSGTSVYRVPHPTFIDSPDITNDDFGDLNKYTSGPVDPATMIAGYGNSWNQAGENSVDWAYDTIASYQPTHYLISGDLVEGHWGEPGDTSGFFGSTVAERIQNMATFYQGQNVERLENAGLFDKLAAIPGDHDYGDNWWRVDDPTGYGKIKYDNFNIWRNSFYENYLSNTDGTPRFPDHPIGTQWDKTAYSTMLSPDMLLVSVDVFDRLANTDNVGNKVAVQVVGKQLAWFRNVLKAARAPGSGIKWIVVQGHVPVITPVRVSHSSGMHLAGRTTAFWQTMKQYNVNLYLAGEVHATSRRSLDGITQITTGSPLEYTGQTTFIAVHEYADHLGLVDWGWTIPENAPSEPAWDGACPVSAFQAKKNPCPPGRVVSMNYDYSGYQPTVEGTLSIEPENTADYGTGNLIEYVNPPPLPAVAKHPSVSLVNSASPASVPGAGHKVTYSFALNNNGNMALSSVGVNPTAFNGKGVRPVVHCPQDTLPVGVSEICTADYTVTPADVDAGTTLSYTATETAISSAGTRVVSNKKTSRVELPSKPAVSLSTSASSGSIGKAGAKVTYSYKVENTGNVALTGVGVRRSAHTGKGVWSTTSCPATSVAIGAHLTCTATYTSTQSDVEAGTAVSSTAVARGKSPTGAAVSSRSATVRTAIAQRPSLSLTETAGVRSVKKAGQRIPYSFAVKNNGNLKMSYLEVNAVFSGTGRPSTFTYPTKTLEPGTHTTVTVVYTVTKADIAAGRPIVSTSTVTGRRFASSRDRTTSNKSQVSVAVR